MLTSYPVYFNDTRIDARPLSWTVSRENIENVNQTEDGHDDVEVVRKGKVTISCAFQCTSFWAGKLSAFNDTAMINVRYYDPAAEGYKPITARMSDLQVDLVQDSGQTPGTNGLYNVTFNLMEF